jgi:hypothetical protein
MSEPLDSADSPGDLYAEPQVRVQKVFRERWRRVLFLTGEVESSVTYDSMSWGERVFLNGEVRARISAWDLRPPRIEFTIPGRVGDLSARIDAEVSLNPWRLGITCLRLTIGRRVIYDEGPDGIRWPVDSEVIDGPVEWDC